MDERVIKVQAMFAEKDRQLNAALAEICNQKGEVAVRDAVIADLQGKLLTLAKDNERLHETAADKVISKAEAKRQKAKPQ